MQLKAYLKKHSLTVKEVAEHWGIVRPVLQRAVNGQRWPNARIMVRAFLMSRGEVALQDWIEGARPILAEQGIIEDGQDGEIQGGGKRRRVRRRKEGDANASP